ncbi:hypothetical protein F5Y04DRAFT_285993 [Hypomontagnella monticulosa]|nr:hypothetical protein F5Y04DRAFT_285993 [Hypomontagnella monticulosa]
MAAERQQSLLGETTGSLINMKYEIPESKPTSQVPVDENDKHFSPPCPSNISTNVEIDSHVAPEAVHGRIPTEQLKEIPNIGGEPNDPKDPIKEDIEQNTISKNKRTSSVLLYCPMNGRSHSSLMDFGILTCPRCGQFLLERNALVVPDTSSVSSGEDPTPNEGKEKRGDRKGVSYFVEYLDTNNETIKREPYSTMFDLDAARKGIVTERSIFDVVTILETSIPSDQRRYGPRFPSMQGRIIDDPIIDVSIKTTRITIHSKPLINAISNVVSYYPSMTLGSDVAGEVCSIVELTEPYAVIAHHIEELETYRGTYAEEHIVPNALLSAAAGSVPANTYRACDKETFEHLGTLLSFVKDSIYKDRIRDEKLRHARNMCIFNMLWLLYRPGNTVYLESEGKYRAYVVQLVEVDESVLSAPQKRPSPYVVELWNLDFDGRFVGRSNRSVTIPYFEGECDITKLKLIPCEFIDKQDNCKTRNQLQDQGRRWFKLILGGQVHYAGEFASPSKGKHEGRVYVDPSSYYSQYPRNAPVVSDIDDMGEGLAKCTCEDCRGRRVHPPPGFPWASYDLIDPSVEEDLAIEATGVRDVNHRYLLCASVLWGFVLKSRDWEKLHISHCHEAKIKVTAIDTLVMPEDRKDMIKALVHKFTGPSARSSSGAWAADFISNKGEGQIFLLHGSPGVGKTYTAGMLILAVVARPECIAEYTGRALLSLTSGDIGTDEVEMEERLSKWFRLAEKWGAVMLIDEADVYLERRMISDLKRNSLVSVFLRCIEYYRGILFLTTNRVGHFDDAFVSRIHVIIRYTNLSNSDRNKIWNRFFDKLSDDRQDFIITGRAKAYILQDEAISKMEWNGREIRNAFQTAVALAEYRFSQRANPSESDLGPTLDQKDFEQVCEMTRQFKDYLTNIYGIDEDGRAFRSKARANQDYLER